MPLLCPARSWNKAAAENRPRRPSRSFLAFGSFGIRTLVPRILGLGSLLALGVPPVHAQLTITEFMADNRNTLMDEDGLYSDWIELRNSGVETVNLDGWFLTDKASDPAKWRFPSTNLAGGGYLVVFASGKSRATPGTPLHTNFQLSREGEYLALIKPDGRTLAAGFSPRFPPQFPDVSYGAAMDATAVPLVTPETLARAFVPPDGSLGLAWTGGAEPFLDGAWRTGPAAVGFHLGKVASSALRRYWRFDGSADEAAGLGSAAQLQGAAFSQDVPPQLGAGLSLWLDGANSRANLGNAQFAAGTFALWIKPSDVGAGAGDRRLLSHVAGPVSQAGSLAIDPNGALGKGSLWIWNGAQWLRLCADGALRTNVWQHLALVVSDSRVTCYLNGVQQNQVSCAVAFDGPALVLGAPFLGAYGNPFAGGIDEVAVWNRLLDANQVGQLAAGRAPTAIEFTADPAAPTAQLVAAYSFEEAPGTKVARDSVATSSATLLGFDLAAAWIGGPGVPPAALGTNSATVLAFDGIDDQVNLGVWGLGAGTLSLWVRPSSPMLDDQRLFSHATGGVDQGGAIRIVASGAVEVWDGSTWLPLTLAGAVKPEAWQHLAFVFTGREARGYVNGQPGLAAACTFDFNLCESLLGGKFLRVHGRTFAGRMDDLSIWNLALDPAQLSALAAGVPPLNLASYGSLIACDVEGLMRAVNASICVRVPFRVEAPDSFERLTLRMQYDDGFVAWLNGQEIARRNAPTTLAWDSAATGAHQGQRAVSPEEIDVSGHLAALRSGTNILAIQGLNLRADDATFLARPELRGQPRPMLGQRARYFTRPTPGAPNGVVPADVGPSLTDAAHQPASPNPGDDLVVTVRVAPTFYPTREVALRYRTMFGPELALPLADDGQHDDGLAGDGLYGARIPSGTAGPGQMLRYFVTASDSAGRESRWPLPLPPQSAPQYLGTVVADPSLVSLLPVLHWFVADEAAAATRAGTQAALFFLNTFYDNVFVRTRGAASAGLPKPSQKFDFLPGYSFQYAAGARPVEEFNLLSTYADPSYVRELLSYETYRDAGAVASDAMLLRVQRNGAFYSLDTFVEQPDEDYLTRHGLDPVGALYKMYNALEDPVARSYSFYTSDNDKRTREGEDFSDLRDLSLGVNPTNSASARAVFLFDHVNLPAMLNYLAATVLIQDLDHETHNYFAYRDTEGSGEWCFLPWDRNFSFGVGNPPDQDPGSHPLLGCSDYIYPPWQSLEGKNVQWNHLTDAIYDTPITRQMFLRRLRTLMDQLLQPPGLPDAELRFSHRLDTLYQQAQAEAALDSARWSGANFGAGISDLKRFLEARRRHLYQTHSVTNLGRYPQAAGIPQTPIGHPPITFGVIESAPASSNQDEEFIEVRNPTDAAADISGWRLAGGVRHTFAPGVVLPARGSLYVSPNVRAFRSRATGPTGGRGLFVQGNYSGHLSGSGETLDLVADDGDPIASIVTSAADTDHDGLPDAWELAWFSALDVDGAHDSDGDGLTNIDEYIAGSNPRLASSRLSLLVTRAGSRISLTFDAWPAVGPGYTGLQRLYSIESRPALTASPWQPVEGYTMILGAGQNIVYPLPTVLNSQQFYRIRVELR